MNHISLALALHDMAARVDRLRFQLRALPAPPQFPGIVTVTAQINTLSEIVTAVCGKVRERISDLDSPGSRRALQAYSDILAPLGEAATELGRIHTEVAQIHFSHPAKNTDEPELVRRRHLANEAISGSCEAADEILEVIVSGLQDEAAKLAPPAPGRFQAASHPSYAAALQENRPASALPPPPAPLKPAVPKVR
ncbi:hypothetical protein [Streptomyces anulatus]|uniref:hypothetical protein n=1 Tax=Streptomyces anulatus TaxID=1892 RepID=UPI00340B0063